ncbi:hypothetical protein [Muricoccus radiodurans]|uniref:hypothetical protein n=1 Tax=Muricoccus radiodurans TaxID=2231721 RepID=UPI003CF302E8
MSQGSEPSFSLPPVSRSAPGGPAHWQITFNGDVIGLTAALHDRATLDGLIDVLEACRALFPSGTGTSSGT